MGAVEAAAGPSRGIPGRAGKDGAGEDGGAGRAGRGGGGGQPALIRRPGRGMEGERADGPAAPAESGTSEVFAQLWADVMGILVSAVGTGSGTGAAAGTACRGTGGWGGGMQMLRGAPVGLPGTCCGICPSWSVPVLCGHEGPRKTNFMGKATGCVGDRRRRGSGVELSRLSRWKGRKGRAEQRQGAGPRRGCPLAGTHPGAPAQPDQWAHCPPAAPACRRFRAVRAEGGVAAAFASPARFGVKPRAWRALPRGPGHGRPARSAPGAPRHSQAPALELFLPVVFRRRVARLRPVEFLRR